MLNQNLPQKSERLSFLVGFLAIIHSIVKEEKRLAATVLAIDEETSIVPRGAVILTSDHRVLVNPSFEGMKLSLFVAQFEGLNMPGAMSLRSYLHLREPRNLAKKSLLEKEGLSKSFDFLDTADEDVPKGNLCSLCLTKILRFMGFAIRFSATNDYDKITFVAWFLLLSCYWYLKPWSLLYWNWRAQF